jgi:hypothetical protein
MKPPTSRLSRSEVSDSELVHDGVDVGHGRARNRAQQNRPAANMGSWMCRKVGCCAHASMIIRGLRCCPYSTRAIASRQAILDRRGPADAKTSTKR